MRTFRGVTAAASLKLYLGRDPKGRDPRFSRPFRGVTAAASLKLYLGLAATRITSALPRRHCRGLIEAPTPAPDTPPQ